MVPPGLTGWAQVNLPYADSVDAARAKLEYDLYYVKHRSVMFDPGDRPPYGRHRGAPEGTLMAPGPGRRSAPRDGGGDRSLTWPRVSVAIAVLLVLAFVVPYGAVQALHKKRLRAADEGTRAMAERVTPIVAGRPSEIPAGTEVLAGPGDRPVVNDERWNSARSVPFARLLPVLSGDDPAAQPDPWGNAYLVNVAALTSADTVWVLSAGPDGIVQTPFFSQSPPLGDDRAAVVR